MAWRKGTGSGAALESDTAAASSTRDLPWSDVLRKTWVKTKKNRLQGVGFFMKPQGSIATAAVAACAIANVRAFARTVTTGAVATCAATFFTGAGEVHHNRASINGHAV